jgi:hypothetical protein
MSVSRLRWRVALALGAAAAALVALAVPAGASTGTRWTSPEMAGYVATNAQFKVINAHVYLRNPTQYASQVASYRHSLQLWSSDVVVTFGVTASTSGRSYTPYATVYDRSTHQVIASNPNATGFQPFGFGEELNLRIEYIWGVGLNMNGWADNGGPQFSSTYKVTPERQSFTQARIGTEFGSSPWDASYSHVRPQAMPLKIASYNGVGLSSYNSHYSTLWSWWVHHKLLAFQSGDLVAAPNNLKNGGASFQAFFE